MCNVCANAENGSRSLGHKCKLYCLTFGAQNRNFYVRCQYIMRNRNI
jgi:hypothetical protein